MLASVFGALLPGEAGAAVAAQQGVDLANRPISAVKVTGIKRVKEALVFNQIRSIKGNPYDPKGVEEDIRRLTHLGQFKTVTAQVMPQNDGSVALTFVVDELPLLSDVRVIGNKEFSDEKILGYEGSNGWVPGHVVLRAGDGADDFLIDKSIQRIKDAYQKEGYFQVDVSTDKEALKDQSVLIFRVREGPLLAIRDIRYEGNTMFSGKELSGQIKSETSFLIFRSGSLNRDTLDGDKARIRDFYRDRGYLEADAGYRVDISPDEKDAVIVFVVEEGQLHTVGSIKVEGNQIFSTEQILEAMPLKVGDVFAADKVRRSQTAVYDLYGKLGYIDVRLFKADGKEGLDRIFHTKDAKVDVIVRLREGKPHFVDKIELRGNEITRDNVVIRELRGLEPGRRFDRAGIELSQRRLRESPLFDQATITVLGDSNDEARSVLVDVEETARPGTLSFGAAVSSDAGVIGAIDLVQKNFDIADFPDDLGELFAGKAFRGAGQFFSLTLQPGNDFSNYSVRFREPYFLESPFFFDVRLRYFDREREDWDEQRAGGSLSVGHIFGDHWRAQVTPRFDRINIDDVEPFAPIDVFDVAGSSDLTALGFSITHDTTNSRVFPTQGSVWEMGVERVGVIGGNYDFTKISAEFHKYWKVDEDFFGRATVLSFRAEMGYIVDGKTKIVNDALGGPHEISDVPVFERLYAGGHRSFRGFEFRGVGPRGIRNDTGTLGDDPVGGDFLFLAGFEYNWPIYQDLLRAVVFVDSGTVQKDFGFDEYRVAVGAGIRIKIPFLGQAPFALDFAIPLRKEDGDETQFFSFDLALPF